MDKKLIDVEYPYSKDTSYTMEEEEELDIPRLDIKAEKIFFLGQNEHFIIISFKMVKSIEVRVKKILLTEQGEVGIYYLCIEYFGNEKFEIDGVLIDDGEQHHTGPPGI